MTAGRKELGRVGEELAARFLQASGYVILERNWRCRSGEIDLICRKGDRIVFVEVRTRSGKGYGTPEESVDARKQRQVRETALVYLQRKGWLEKPVSFDVVAVRRYGNESEALCRHIPQAF